VAPLDVEPVDQVANSRSVWIPPGDWVDGWTGAVVSGPRTLANVTQPPSRIPMWHRKGAVLVTATPSPTGRLVHQDWAELIVHAWPAAGAAVGRRVVYEQEGNGGGTGDVETPTVVEMITRDDGTVSLTVTAAPVARAWLVRLHLDPGQHLQLSAGADAKQLPVRHVPPAAGCKQNRGSGSGGGVTDSGASDAEFFPFLGEGAPPPCMSGAVAEFRLAQGRAPVRVEGKLTYT